MSATDLEDRVLTVIERHRQEDGGINWTVIVGKFNGGETSDVEAALSNLHEQGCVRYVGRERTSRRVFLTEASERPRRLDHETADRVLSGLYDDGYDVAAAS
ncbi:hypothetical protein [Streptomyces sp. NPDC057250]|uniref:hypothetical protein n=1 Tax=Streptomyces sp. NPDC057250 TaxID=3346068 RepID=UPI003642A93F